MKRLMSLALLGVLCLASTADAQTVLAPPVVSLPGAAPATTVYAPTVRPSACCPPAPRVTYRPVMPVLPMPPAYEVGRGILGQPKLYVPGQPVRNFFRYLTP